jgi:hypothetical protein
VAWTVAMATAKPARATSAMAEATATTSMAEGVAMPKTWVDADRVATGNPSQIRSSRPNLEWIWDGVGLACLIESKVG